MGLLDLFKRSRKSPAEALAKPVLRELPAPPALDPPTPQPPSAAELRIMLFDAIATGDEEKLARLCRDHHNSLLDYLETWSIVPDTLKDNAVAADWYAEGIRAIARFCDEKGERGEGAERLQSPPRGPLREGADPLDAHAA